MSNITNFESLRLNNEALEKVSVLRKELNAQEKFEFQTVSIGNDFLPCAYCKINGCYGACSVGR